MHRGAPQEDEGRHLKKAPILEDARSIAGDSQALRAEAMVASTPRQGFSGLGLRKGLADNRSSLLDEVIRFATHSRPKFIFLENVCEILPREMDHLSSELHNRLGYELRWACVPASAVGVPHIRNRWFCLATLPGFRLTWTDLSYIPFVWGDEPARHVERVTADLYPWLGLLEKLGSAGRSTVRLHVPSTGFRRQALDKTELSFIEPDPYVVRATKLGGPWPSIGGVSLDGRRYTVKAPPFEVPRLSLSINGLPAPEGFVYNRSMTTPLVLAPMIRTA
jgi:site-specific DNA-cytosine methylase